MVSITYADSVSCDPEIFKKNSCDICYDWWEIGVNDKSITFPETIITWENKSENFNHNIYKASQNDADIITDIGTVEENWHETAIVWAESVVWSKFAGVDKYILASKQKIDFRKIEKNTVVPMSNFKTSTIPIVLKIPIKYHEIESGSFTQWAEKTSNNCISYSPKITANTTTTSSNVSTPPPTTTTVPKTNTNTNTTTNSNTSTPPPTTTTVPKTSTTETPETVPPVVEKPPVESSDKRAPAENKLTDDEIPYYNAKVSLNAAGPDPTMAAATRVAAGPAENMLVFWVALMLSLLLFPKLNKRLNRE